MRFFLPFVPCSSQRVSAFQLQFAALLHDDFKKGIICTYLPNYGRQSAFLWSWRWAGCVFALVSSAAPTRSGDGYGGYAQLRRASPPPPPPYSTGNRTYLPISKFGRTNQFDHNYAVIVSFLLSFGRAVCVLHAGLDCCARGVRMVVQSRRVKRLLKSRAEVICTSPSLGDRAARFGGQGFFFLFNMCSHVLLPSILYSSKAWCLLDILIILSYKNRLTNVTVAIVP